MPYRESSKIVRMATHDAGVVSAIAKGALRPKSRFGAALQPLSDGIAQMYMAEHHDLHTLAEFDLTHLRTRLAADLGRYAAAVTLAELMIRFAPQAPHPESFDVLREALSLLEEAPHGTVDVVSLRCIWRLVSELGFEPALDRCARDGTPVPPDGDLRFSAAEGGALCPRCSGTTGVARLDARARADLRALLTPGAELPELDNPHGTAHRRLVSRYVRYHLAEGIELPALRFWTTREMEQA